MTRGRRASHLTILTILTGITLAVTAFAAHGEESRVTVATVQFRVTEEVFTSIDAYRGAVEGVVASAVERHGADIVVLPEYLNVFLIASRFPEALEQASTIDEALHLAAGRPATGRQRESGELPAVLRSVAEETSRDAIALWQDLAATHEVTIVAGTFFVPSEAPHERGLRNRLIVFGPSGEIHYQQDKVYLTEEERRSMGIRPGALDDAETVELAGITVGFTICRDSFFDSWHEPLDGVELWIDLRANGEPFSRDVEERFRRALPPRVRAAEAAAGVNATLTGSFLDLVWEGRSYVVDESGARIAESKWLVGTEITTVHLVPDEDSWRLEDRTPESSRQESR